ncbi:hypothetical protein AW27_023585 [Streptomyces sp. PCS3-D2]|uniref:hypothetical protein n=1 Tax=Streptomyces sp. PCS3-D2 TaxID=1460244 RepID=UPI000446CE3C|nr:hypothetical protein [Streptomyces sp. PCS3-D2]WKV74227.1 hypothetical protein AW27_023585 [Streptomyces sp. PCS3-D2]
MRRVTLHTLYAGPERSVAAGQTAEFEAQEAARLVDGGFGVYADEPRRKAPAEEPVEKPVEKMTAAELQAYAAEHGIDLSGAKTKAEVLAAVMAAVEAARGAEADA